MNASSHATPPLVTVVVPAHNAAAHIPQLIAGMLQQDYTDWELRIVDDGSTDALEAAVREFPDSRIHLSHQDNQGVSAARNAGLAAAQGEFVVFLDADDWLLPGALARMVTALASQPEAVVVYGEPVRASHAGDLFGVVSAPLFARRPAGQVLETVLRRNFIVTPGVAACRTAAVRRVGGFDTSLRVGEDWVLWCALAAEGPYVYLPLPPLLAYRDSESSAIRTSGLRLEETLASVAVAYNAAAVQSLPAQIQRRCRRRREAGAYCFVAVQHYKAGDFSRARREFGQSLRRYPYSLREWAFYLLSTLRWRPDAVAKRLK